MTQPAPFSFSVCVPVPRLHATLGRGAVQPLSDSHPWEDCPPWDDASPSVLHNLPLNRAEARACLQDFRTAAPEDLSRAVQMAATAYLTGPLGKQEESALSAFVQGNSADRSANTETSVRNTDEQRRLSQRQLLTIWVQEERVLDILQLANRCEDVERRLARLFADPDISEMADDDASSAEQYAQFPKTAQNTAQDLPLDDVSPLLPPWRFVLAQLLPFLPPDALLVVNSPDMVEAVQAEATAESIDISGNPAFATGRVVRAKTRSLMGRAVENSNIAETASLLFLLPDA